ncbi:hypothetical protein BC940DRAFT_172339 [Gongronella butleri]|nr:hypothetical protein BC940DRAFT_172339 [Gongronella butleri]
MRSILKASAHPSPFCVFFVSLSTLRVDWARATMRPLCQQNVSKPQKKTPLCPFPEIIWRNRMKSEYNDLISISLSTPFCLARGEHLRVVRGAMGERALTFGDFFFRLSRPPPYLGKANWRALLCLAPRGPLVFFSRLGFIIR